MPPAYLKGHGVYAIRFHRSVHLGAPLLSTSNAHSSGFTASGRGARPPPPAVEVALDQGTVSTAGQPVRRCRTEFVVIPRSAEIVAAEDALGRALVALIGGTRPPVSPAMVRRYLFDRFNISADEVDVRRHDPEDFIVRFTHRTDRDRVLAAPPMGALLPLIW